MGEIYILSEAKQSRIWGIVLLKCCTVNRLLSKKRASMGVQLYEKPFHWGQISDEYLLHPRSEDILEETSVYPLIWGVQLDSRAVGDANIKRNLQQLLQYADGYVNF